MADSVHSPIHYSAARFGCECIEFTRYMTFPAGNAFKYVFRFADKGGDEDLDKSLVYLQWAAEDWIEYEIPPIIHGAETRVWGIEGMYLRNTVGVYLALNHILHARWMLAEDAIMARRVA